MTASHSCVASAVWQ